MADRLASDSLTAEGTVFAVDPAPDRARFRIRYTYEDVDGARHDGASVWLTPDEAAGWQAEDRGAVRYDPDEPAVSEWIGEPADQARSWAASDSSIGEG